MRTVEKSVVVAAPVEEVFSAWTTEAGVTSFGPPQASIEARRGGRYEWYFMPDAPEGERGSEGCTVQVVLPPGLLAFTWNAPPRFPRLRALGPCTQVVVQFEERGPATLVKLTHVVEGEGAEWDAYIEYFERGWAMVLSGLTERFGSR